MNLLGRVLMSAREQLQSEDERTTDEKDRDDKDKEDTAQKVEIDKI